jgi:hypothetical protein
MKSWIRFILACCVITACDVDTGTNVASVKSVMGPATLRRVPSSRVISAEEAALIERIASYVPENYRGAVRTGLASRRASLRLDDPRAQAAVDSLELRLAQVRGRHGFSASLLTGRTVPTGLVSATIALVQSLDAPGIRAVVLRRTSQPANIVLVTDRTENADVRNALVALLKARAKYGDAPIGDTTILIRAPERASGREMHDIIDWDKLRGAKTRDLSGVGPARTIEVLLKQPSGTNR